MGKSEATGERLEEAKHINRCDKYTPTAAKQRWLSIPAACTGAGAVPALARLHEVCSAAAVASRRRSHGLLLPSSAGLASSMHRRRRSAGVGQVLRGAHERGDCVM